MNTIPATFKENLRRVLAKVRKQMVLLKDEKRHLEWQLSVEKSRADDLERKLSQFRGGSAIYHIATDHLELRCMVDVRVMRRCPAVLDDAIARLRRSIQEEMRNRG